MIMSFRHKGLRRFYEYGERQGLSPALLVRLDRVLSVLKRAQGPEDMALPGFRLHPLKGELEGWWSVSISANWRVVFRFFRDDVVEVDLVDYH